MTWHPWIQLMRLHRPGGFILLFIPCTWGLALAHGGIPPFEKLLFFFLGAVLLRSAGCVYNDWVDQDYDRRVTRTKDRPLASGRMTSFQAWCLIFFLLALSLALFLKLNTLGRFYGLFAAFLATLYPWMKRITRWPQFVLGLAYTMGLWVSYANEKAVTPWPLVFVYVGGVFWTIFYDTIYAHQDASDDHTLGLGTTTQIMPHAPKIFLALMLLLATFFMACYGFFYGFSPLFYILLALNSCFFLYQVYTLDLRNAPACGRLFQSSPWWGWGILFIFLVQK